MPFEVPSPAAILACVSPRDLFGDALDSPRETKRAYAMLVRAYRAEEHPDVFQRVRELYERARSRPDDDRRPEVAAPVHLGRALADRDAQATLHLLQDHAPLLVAEAPDAVVEALRLLILGAGPALAAGALDVVEIVLARPELPLHPDEAEVLVADCLRLRALAVASEDPQVDDAVVAALRAGWRRRADQVAEAWLVLAEALDAPAIDASLARLEHRHPTVLGLFHRQALRMRVGGSAPRLPDLEVLALARQLPPSCRAVRGPGLDLLMSRGGLFAVFALCYGVAQVAGAPLLGAIAAGVVGRYSVLFGLRRWVVPGRVRRFEAALHQGDTAPLIAVARAHAAWPEEVASAVAPPAPLPVNDRLLAYVAGHPLLELRRDPGAVLKVLTRAHLERVRREVESAVG